MSDFFLNLIDSNQQINYGLIFMLAFGYIFCLWIAISIWVYTDAKKRFESATYPILIFFFVLIFNIPALIFYVIVRPDFTFEEEEILEAAIYNNKKLSPIMFQGEQGFDINLNIRVMPKVKGGKDDKHEMDVNLSWIPVNKVPTIEHLKEIEQLEPYINNTKEVAQEVSDAYEEKPEEVKMPVIQNEAVEEKLPMEDMLGSISSKIASFTVAFKKKFNKSTLNIKKQYLSGKKVENKVEVVEENAKSDEKKSNLGSIHKQFSKKFKKKHKKRR